VKTDLVHVADPVRGCKQYQIVHKKQTVDVAYLNSDTLIDLAETIYLNHMGYEEKWRQRTPLSESNT